VAWLPPEGPKPYWRGAVTRMEYEFAEDGMLLVKEEERR